MAPAIRRLSVATGSDRALASAVLLLGVLIALYLWMPWSVDVAELHGTLVVADVRGGALVVLDLEQPETPRRIALPGNPHELALLPDGRVVASLEGVGALAVVDLDSEDIELVELGGTPHGLALRGDELLVTDRSRDELRRLRLDDWTERSPLATGEDPHTVAVLDGGVIATANAAADTLQLGDRVFAVSRLPEAVASAGGELVVAGAGGGEVERFSAGGGRLSSVYLGGRPVRLAYAPDGATLAVALSAAGAVTLLDRDGESARIEVGGVPDGLTFSADGRWLFAGDLLTGSVAVVDIESGREVARWPAGTTAGALLLLPPQ